MRDVSTIREGYISPGLWLLVKDGSLVVHQKLYMTDYERFTEMRCLWMGGDMGHNDGVFGGANQGQKWIFRTSETVHGSLREVYDSSKESIWHIRSGIFLLQRGLCIVRKRYMAHCSGI